MVCFWRKILASVLMVFVVSNENCSAGSESKCLMKLEAFFGKTSTYSWIGLSGRTVAKKALVSLNLARDPTNRDRISRSCPMKFMALLASDEV